MATKSHFKISDSIILLSEVAAISEVFTTGITNIFKVTLKGNFQPIEYASQNKIELEKLRRDLVSALEDYLTAYVE